MKLKILLAGAALLLTAMTAQAVPAKPGVKKTVCQADGTTIELTLRGDEHFSFYTDESGQAYRLLSGDRLERMTDQQVTELWTARKAERMAYADKARTRSPRQAGKPSNATTGKHRGLVILVEFKDVKFASTDPQTVFNRFFNEEGYHEYGNTGSVRDYFLKQSYGKLEIDFDVVGPYTTSGTLANYGAADDNRNDINPTAMVMEGLDAAAQDIDFTPYDWDNDGVVDQVFIICAGYDQAEGADPDYIWPHEWTLGAQGISRTYNGKRINIYGVATELWGDGKRTNLDKGIAGVGTACHEFSHCLGLPDFYDTDGDNFAMGYWSIMCAGNYNNSGYTPAGYTSYERWFAGWLEPVELKEMTRITDMKPLATDPEAYILYNEANKNEYYLLENRQKVGFDKGLYGHGLLVLHVDYDIPAWGSNTVNTSADHQRMTIIPADGKATNNTLPGDPFPGTTNNTLLTNYTTPAATLYNENADGQKLMSKPIDNITESEDGLISFVACRPELGIPEPDDGKEVEGEASFIVSWPAVSGAVGYELELTEIGTASDNPQEALEREFNFDEMVSKSVGFSDVSSQLSKYGLSGWKGSKLFTSPNKMKIGTSTAAGYVLTRDWTVPASAELTVVMGADVAKTGETVKGELVLASYNDGDSQYTKESQKFEVTGNERKVFNFSCRRDGFRIEVRPESQMYLNYLAVYDGTWTAEQLGISKARQYAPLKATTVNTYKTETNSCTLKDLNTRSRFFYRVRAIGEENTYSQWSEEKAFKFTNMTGIMDVYPDGSNSSAPIYDLRGRNVGTDPEVLGKGVYIINGKKVVK